MSELSEKSIEDVVRKIISQTTANKREDSHSLGEPYEELSKLKQKVDSFLQEPSKFNTGDVVKWKKGLKNKKYPKEEQLAMVVQELEEPVIQGERDSGTPYFREPLDLILGVLDQEDDLMLFHYDKRRFEIVERAK
ncbi:hypothetical protein [Candidatus Parabeggiatoa sp. HSG14]|uniref:hypothetical protein n=1 Tax=Candidatus Parabeggiatoa sp. HSG14 TaxID=3055593 RepID=UPI0025A91166|nr:hypothetical protein [Thiotrichales bacterium HSG14]